MNMPVFLWIYISIFLGYLLWNLSLSSLSFDAIIDGTLFSNYLLVAYRNPINFYMTLYPVTCVNSLFLAAFWLISQDILHKELYHL